MYKSDNKVGLIEQYKQELKSIQNHSFTNSDNIGYWNRLTDYISKFSTDQLKFIDNNQQVIKAHNDMLNTFVQYLFEKNKDDFAAFDEFRPVCDTYIDCVIKTASEYDDKVSEALNENAELKNKLKEYEKRIAEVEGTKNGHKAARTWYGRRIHIE